MRWIVETGAFPATAPRITAALDARGIPWLRAGDDVPDDALPMPGEPALCWCSLGLAYGRFAGRWQPGAVGRIDDFSCRAYYPELAPWLANRDAIATTVARLVSDPAAELLALGSPPRVFVRPDSAAKPFAGRVLAADAITAAALDHGFYYDDLELPVMVSRVRQIGREWRFVVGDAAIIAGCSYAPVRRPLDPSDDAVRTFAAEAARIAPPAPLYVLDVGEVDGALRVLELNPFSGADFYACDADAVVVAATAIAESV